MTRFFWSGIATCSSSADSMCRNVRAVLQETGFEQLNPADALKRLEALPEFTDSPDFQKLAVRFKRVKNIAQELP